MTHECTYHPAGSDPCYTRHGCRCEPCRATHGREAKRRRHARASGHPTRLDAGPTVAHLRALLASGMGRAEVSRRAGLHGTNLARLLRGDQKTVTPARAAAILAIRPTPVDRQRLGAVDSIGTRRRVQALMALGWHLTAIAADAGVPPCTIRRILDGADVCIAATRRKVAATYDRLWNRTPPTTRSHLDSRARNLARRSGWPPPMAWDDDTIDDPAAVPEPGTSGARGATEEDIADCIAGGETSVHAVARRVGVRPDTVKTVLHRAGRGDLLARLEDDPLAQAHNQYTTKGKAA